MEHTPPEPRPGGSGADATRRMFLKRLGFGAAGAAGIGAGAFAIGSAVNSSRP